MTSVFDNYDPEAVSTKPVMAGGYDKFVRLDYGQEIIMKLMTNPHPDMKDRDGNPLRVFMYKTFWFETMIKGKVQRIGRPSLALQGEEDPQEVLVKKIRDEMDALKKAGQDTTARFAALDKAYKKFKPSLVAVLLFVRPGSAKVEALSVPATVADEIFGKTAYKDKQAKEGLYAKMKGAGRNPFDMKSNKGWICITKTGTTWNDTKYPVSEAKSVSVDESGEEVTKNLVAAVSPDLFKATLKDIPDVRKIASQFMWTMEEVNEYIASKGTKIPQRVLEGSKPTTEDDSEVETPFEAPTEPVESKKAAKPAETKVESKPAETKKVEPEVKAAKKSNDMFDAPNDTSDSDDLDSLFEEG